MKNTTKGTIAIAAGLVLLLGGAGTLAYWTETETAAAQNDVITTGHLKVDLDASPSWSVTHNNGTATPTTEAITDIAAFRMVPGDTVTYTVPFSTDARGTNLTAEGTVAWGGYTSLPTGLASSVAGTYDGAAIANGVFDVVSSEAGSTANGTLVFTLTWPFGTDTSSPASTMDQAIDLSQTTVTVTQK